MGSKKTKTTSNQTATTTPTAPGYLSSGIQNYYTGVNDFFSKNDPSSLVTPVNSYQQQALDQASKFGGTSSLFDDAAGIAKSIASGGSTTPLQSQNVAGVQAPGLAEMPKVAQASLGAGLLNPTAPQASAGGAGEIERAGSASLLDGLQNYQNPYTQGLVDTTLANYDHDAGKARAAYELQGAANKAFGGSGYYIGQADLLSGQNRERANLEATLRSDAMDKAYNLSNLDAARRQETGIFNAGQANDRGNINAQLATQASIANAGNQNSRDMSIASLLGEIGMFNAGQQNDMAMAGFDATNDINAMIYQALHSDAQQNASSANDMTKFNASLAADEQGRQLQAAGLLNDTASAQGSQQIANTQQLMSLGEMLWNLQNRQTQAPLTYLQAWQDLLNPSTAAPVTGQTVTSNGTSTTKESGGLLGDLLGPLGQIGAAAITKSERRVKRDINLLRRDPDGVGWYRYRYLWDGPEVTPHVGVMVDEVEQLRPWALGPIVDGVKTVDYSKLEAR